MKRKIVIEKCSECPFVEEYLNAIVIGPRKKLNDKYIYHCGHEMNANAPEEIKTETIPEWCQLEKDED